MVPCNNLDLGLDQMFHSMKQAVFVKQRKLPAATKFITRVSER